MTWATMPISKGGLAGGVCGKYAMCNDRARQEVDWRLGVWNGPWLTGEEVVECGGEMDQGELERGKSTPVQTIA
jgi:hypothetical protein